MTKQSIVSDQTAKNIFEEIRDRPYRVPEYPGDQAWQCYNKSVELISRLTILGYGLRCRVGLMNWADIGLPADILALAQTEWPATHFYPEIYRDGEWQVLDPSWDDKTASFGMNVCTWEGPNRPCFPIAKLYSQDEQQACLAFWADPANERKYFEKASAFQKAFNRWLAQKRAGL